MMARIYEFDDFRLHAATRELVRADGRTVVLPARIFDCLTYLIEQRERAVDRDELVAVIWNRSDVGDNVLAQLMARTRRILADTGDQQRIIRTIPGFGYHWIVPTRALSPPATPEAQPPDSGLTDGALSGVELKPAQKGIGTGSVISAPKRKGRKAAWSVALIVTTLVVAGSVAWMRQRPAVGVAAVTRSTPLRVPTVSERPALVLPAIVETNAGENWLRLGIMALVGERLAEGGQPTVPTDNVVALTRGMDIATLDSNAYSALANAAVANWVVLTRVAPLVKGWRVELSVVHSQEPIRLAVSAEGEQVLDAAREAVDRLLVGMGAGHGPQSAAEDSNLVLVLKQAQSEYLGGKPEVARKILAEAVEQHPGSTELAYQLALMEYTTGKLDPARIRLESLVSNTVIQDDPVLLARVFNALADVSYQHRDFVDVARYSRQTIRLLQGSSDGMKELGQAWRTQGALAGAEGRYEESIASATRARVMMAASGDWLGVARADSQSGITLHRAGRLHESLPLLERAADRLQQFHDAWLEGVVRSHIIATQVMLGEPASALAQEPRMRELDERIEHPGMRAAMKLARADALIANGRLNEARPLIAQAYQQILTQNDRLNVYFAHAVAARFALASGERSQAEAEATKAIATLFDPEEDERHVAWTYLMLVRLQASHDLTAAAATRDALGIRVGAQNKRNARLYLHLADAALGAARRDIPMTRKAFEQALALADAAPIDLLRTAQSYVPWLIEQGEQGRAAEIVGRLGDIPYRNFEAALLEVQIYKATRQQTAWQDALNRVRSLAADRAIPESLLDFPGSPLAPRE